MTESEYIKITNRVKVSMALTILGNVITGDGHEYGISSQELGEITRRLALAEDKLIASRKPNEEQPGSTMMKHRLAPWPDYHGHDIYEGDVIEHPSGDRGTVVFLAAETDPCDQWRVDYKVSGLPRLCLQIGDKGQAVVVHNDKDKGREP